VSVGSSLSIDWRLADVHPLVDNKLVIGLGFELRYDWLTLSGEPIAPLSQRALDTWDGLKLALDGVAPTQIAAVTPRIAYTNIDSLFDPSRGFAAEVFYRISPPPLVPLTYSVLGASVRGYATVWERLTLAGGARLRLGFSGTSDRCGPEGGCEWALMQSDLLLVGGERTVRGVAENQVGVIGPIYDQQLRPVTDRGGPVVAVHPGFYSGVMNLELRYTLIKQLFIGSVKPALFADAGVSTSDFTLPSFATDAPIDLRYATSVGVGLRYVMPVGPLAIDFAYSPTRQTTGVHIQFGYVF
jgi:outer membrane protein assembly factor BamA